MTRKKTRKEKIRDRGGKPKGSSKYAIKIAQRRKMAHELGMPESTPYPLLWISQ